VGAGAEQHTHRSENGVVGGTVAARIGAVLGRGVQPR